MSEKLLRSRNLLKEELEEAQEMLDDMFKLKDN